MLCVAISSLHEVYCSKTIITLQVAIAKILALKAVLAQQTTENLDASFQ